MSFWYQNGVCSNNRHSHRQDNRKTCQVVGAFLIISICGVVAQAQDATPPGFIARFDITQQLEYSDNPDLDEDGDSDLYGRTIFGLALESVTNVQRFSFNLGTELEEWRDDQSTFDFTNSSASLGYDRDTQNANIGLNLRYRESDENSEFFDDEFDLDGNVINQDSGTRKSYGVGLDGAFGLQDPIGASYRLDYTSLEYNDTDDPDLTDQSNLDIEGALNFRLDPRIVARLTAKYIDFDTDGNGVDRETTGLGAGVVLDINPRLVADIGLSYDNIDRSGDETGTDDGITATVDLTQQMTNGTVGLSFASDVTSNDDGRRTFLRLDRVMDLTRSSSVNLSLGATYSDGAGVDPIVNLEYIQQRPSSSFNIGLSQRVNTDSDNEEEINTTLRAGYAHSINNTSSLGLDVALFDRNELGDNPDDGQRYDIGITYRHELTRDWSLIGSYTYRFETSDEGSDRDSNTVFVGIQRSFEWNP